MESISEQHIFVYEGDWTNILRTRLLDPDTKAKFFALKRRCPTLETRTQARIDQECARNPSCRYAVDIPYDVYQRMLDESQYDANVEKVFNSTQYTEAHQIGRSPKELGWSKGLGDEGTVFKDGQFSDGTNLDNNRHKNIIEAHEKLHGVVMGTLTNREKDFIKTAFLQSDDIPVFREVLPGYTFDQQVDEIIARMSQLKNFFGFAGGESFTKAHLDFARENYVYVTGIDNGMTALFNAIRPDNENKFIELMNTIAC